MDLDGRTALVTGASKNIGRATAIALAERGADVGIATKRDEAGLAETARAIERTGRGAATSVADLAEPDEIVEMVDTVRTELGPIDVLINNATYRPTSRLLDLDAEEIDAVAAVNIRGVLLTTQAVVPDMLELGRGSIVNLIGQLVYLGRPGKSHAYGTKMGIEGIVRQLATELGPEGIRVNGLSPGLIDTERERTDEWRRIIDRVVAATPLGRLGETGEIADAACFLASDRSSFVTGQVLHVNGGTYPTPNVVPADD